MDLELGTHVRATKELKRITRERRPEEKSVSAYTRLLKEWVTQPIVDVRNRGSEVRKHRAGLVIGLRNLSNGGVEYGYDEGTQFFPESHFQAVIVAYDLRRKPFLVLPDDLEVLASPQGAVLL